MLGVGSYYLTYATSYWGIYQPSSVTHLNLYRYPSSVGEIFGASSLLIILIMTQLNYLARALKTSEFAQNWITPTATPPGVVKQLYMTG